MVLHGHFLYLSNDNFLSQKEQIRLVGAELPGGVGVGVDSVLLSSFNPLSSVGCGELFISLLFVVLLLDGCEVIVFLRVEDSSCFLEVIDGY